MAEEDLEFEGPEQDASELGKKYEAIIKNRQAQAPLRTSWSLAQELKPDQAGDIIKLSKRTGLDKLTIKEDFDNIKRAVDTPTPKQTQMLIDGAPKTAVWLEDEYNASATKDDRQLLQSLEAGLNEDPLLRSLTDDEMSKSANDAVERRIKAMVADSSKPFNFMGGAGGAMPVTTPAVTDTPELRARLFQQEMAIRRAENAFVVSREKMGAGETLTTGFEKNPAFMVPFLAAAPEIGAASDLYQRVERAKEGTATPEDMDLLIRHARLEAAKERRGKTFGGHVTELGMGLPAFIGELAATGGAATAARRLVLGEAKSLAMRALGKTLEIGAQTALAQGLRIGANTFVYGTPDTTVTQDENGQLQLQITDDRGAGMTVPFVKAVGSSLIDVGSAHIPFHPAFKFWAKTTKVNPTVENFMKQYAKGGVESILGGIAINDATKLAKELVGLAGPVQMPDTIKALTGDPEALKRVGAQAVVFGPMGVAGSHVQRRRAQAELIQGEALSYKEMLHNASETVKGMQVQAKHPEVVADAVKEMVKDTTQEYTYVPAAAFFDHYSKLGINADQFAAELTGKPQALQDAIAHGTDLQVPTDQYLTKIGATDAGPVFEKAGARTKADVPTVDEAKDYIKQLDKESKAEKKPKATPDEERFAEQVKTLGESMMARTKEQGFDLAKFVEKDDAKSAERVVSRVAAATTSADAARENFGQTKGLLEDVPNLVMNEKEAASYAKLRKEAQDAAYSRLDTEALADLNRERKRQYAYQEADVRTRIAKEVEQLPEYRVQSVIETGLEPDGTVTAPGGLKFDRDIIRELYGETTLEALPKKMLASSKEAGNDPQTVADILGLSSADELIQKMANLENKEALIDRRTNEVMQKMNLAELEELPQKAKEAIHSDEEAKVKAYQLKWLVENRLPQMKDLLRKVASPKRYVEDVRDYAVDKVAKMSARENNPGMFEMAERRANKAAREALLSGDLEGAVRFMELELLNHEQYRASIAARNDGRRIREYAAEFDKSDKRKLLYAAGEQYLAQSDAILEQYSFKKQSAAKLEKLKSLKEFIESEADEGYIAQIPEKLLTEAGKKNWQDIPLEDLRGIEQMLRQLENNATLKATIKDGRETVDVNTRAAEMAQQIRSSKKALEKPIDSYTEEQESLRTKISTIFSPRNDAAIYREMDGFKDGGVMQQTISRRLNESGTKEAILNERATAALDAIYGKFSKAEQLKMRRQKYIPEINGSLSTWQRMEIAATLGQEGARQRYADGRGWGDAQLQAVVDGLTEKQWQWVADVHKFLKTYEADVKAQIERRTGLPAKMVKPVPIETPFGTQEGGYFPFKYDTRTDPKTRKVMEIEEAKRSVRAAGIQAQTKHGYTETRSENVKGKRLRFDAGVLFEHIREVNHDIAYSETLRDLNRLLAHKDVSQAIYDTYGDQVYHQLTNSLNDIAMGDKPAANAFERGADWLRRGGTTAVLGWNFMNAITDQTGLTQGAVRLGGLVEGSKWIAKGWGKFAGSALRMENGVKEVHQLSDMMRLRAKTFMREVNEVRNQVQKKGTAAMYADMGLEMLTGGKLDIQDVNNTYYWVMTKAQMMQEVPVWLGAFEKAKAEHPLEPGGDLAKAQKKWVSLADQVVLDAYGGGQIKDLAPIQKGGSIQKLLLSTFYSFANRTLNNAIESGYKFARGPKSVGSVGRLAGDMLLLYTLPAAMMFAIKNIATQNDKDLEKRLGQDIAGSVLGSIPLAREIVPAVAERDYTGPGGLRFFSSASKVAKSAWQGEADWKALNQTAGTLFHYPALALERFVTGMEAWLDRGTGTPLSPLLGPPKKR